jgi:hypothetical protein
MLFSYHSLPDLEKSLLSSEPDSESEPETPLHSGEYTCFTNIKYVFYLLFLLMVLFFLIFIIIVIMKFINKI